MSKKENLKIEYADISLLKRYERNAKIYTKQQVAKLVQSMKTSGVPHWVKIVGAYINFCNKKIPL